jgi:outer membrane receptor protein involved in Fe transport
MKPTTDSKQQQSCFVRLTKTGLMFSALVFAACPIIAQSEQQSPWRADLTAGAIKQFETSLQHGGEFELQRYFISASANRLLDASWSAGISLYYGQDDYEFGSSPSLAGTNEPWDDIHELRVSMPVIHRGQAWSTLAIPSIKFRREANASWSDSHEVGLLAGSAYRFSDRLSLGPGFGVYSQIEDDVDIFPILLVDWQITDQLSLETGRGLAASRGPGVSLHWQANAQWKLALGVRYENIRFRLDDKGPAPNGVGQNRAYPLNLSISYEPNPDLQFDLVGGVAYAGELQLEDADGRLIQDSEYDTAPYLGLIMSLGL